MESALCVCINRWNFAGVWKIPLCRPSLTTLPHWGGFEWEGKVFQWIVFFPVFFRFRTLHDVPFLSMEGNVHRDIILCMLLLLIYNPISVVFSIGKVKRGVFTLTGSWWRRAG